MLTGPRSLLVTVALRRARIERQYKVVTVTTVAGHGCILVRVLVTGLAVSVVEVDDGRGSLR